jgi:hypothetical protein
MVFEVRLKRVPVIHDGTWDSEDPYEVTGRGSPFTGSCLLNVVGAVDNVVGAVDNVVTAVSDVPVGDAAAW